MALSVQTIHLINSFDSDVDDRHAQNVLLHAIFSRIIMHDMVTEPKLFLQTTITLARLYWDQKWDPARVFFYMLTGFLLNDEELTLTQSAFPQLNSYYSLNPDIINGLCDLHAGIFNALWYNFDEDDEEEEEEEEEEDEDDEA